MLLSSEDGRATIVDLTKTLAEMSQQGKLSPENISLDLVDTELSESTIGEPDLLIVYGPYVKLSGFPPWQLRLTEIYHARDDDGSAKYLVWLQALKNYGKAQMRHGR